VPAVIRSDGAELAELITAWERALTVGNVPASDLATLPLLASRLACATAAGLAAPEDAERAGAKIGQLLFDGGMTTPAAIQQAVLLLGEQRLNGSTESAWGVDLDCLTRMQGAAVVSHGAATQQRLLEQQAATYRAAITARDQAEAGLSDSQARNRALFTDAAVGIGIGDIQGRVVQVNEAFRRMLGDSVEEFVDPIEQLTHPEDPAGVWDDYAALTAGTIDSFTAEKPYRHKDGHTVWTHLTVSLARDADGKPLFQVAMVQDITERHRLQEELLHEATHDALTGLPNRALFLQHLDAATAGTEEDGRVAVLFIDLDGFKFVNDSRGHLVGDQVLAAAAARLAATAEAHGAMLARLAGDEFVVLTTGSAGQTHSASLADQLLDALDQPIQVDGQRPVNVRASVGVVELPVLDASAEDLLRAADLALHAAKEEGKGRVVAHDPTRTARQLSRFRIAMDLPRVEDRGELGLNYQPIVRLDNKEVHSVEALMRWHHPQLGRIAPDLFVGIAEESSAIISIGRWALQQACIDLARSPWPAVSVNVSVRQLYSRTFVQDVRRCLEVMELSPERLRIEVTESVLMQADDAAPVVALKDLADLGVLIVMDDFGTGYSNLASLRRMPFHELKLAGTFLEGLLPDRSADHVDLLILGSVVDLAHALGLTVTAEGVETQAQNARVLALGCDYGQGLYYSPATPR
jgi:diguanylate cyclase (GGDEF)-like protein/PAS domain S-box-containing protein